MTQPTETGLTEPDNPSAWALARHIADHPVSVVQAAFRYLNTPLTIELHGDPAATPAGPAPATNRNAAPTDWVDGHPQLEAIAAAVWERCDHSDSGLIIDDPRNIAVAALAAVLPAPDRAAALSDRERSMLGFALEMAQEEIHARSLEFTDDDKSALDSLRRLAGEAQQDRKSTAEKAADLGLTDTEYRARSHTAAVATVRAAIPGMYAHVGFRLEDVLNEANEEQPTDNAREAQQDPKQDGRPLCSVAGCGHDELAHTVAGCRDCPRGQRAFHLFSLPAVARSGQPETDEETLVHVGWWCWRGDNHGHLATMACRSDNVPIHVPAEWADDMRAVLQRIEDGDEPETD